MQYHEFRHNIVKVAVHHQVELQTIDLLNWQCYDEWQCYIYDEIQDQ